MKSIAAISLFFILFLSEGQPQDLLYQQYVAALTKRSTYQYYLVVKVTDLNTGRVKEVCTHGALLCGAIHFEYDIPFSDENRVLQLAIKNRSRSFQFRDSMALKNVNFYDYSAADLKALEAQIDFDSLANKIRRDGKMSIDLTESDGLTLKKYAHALFNRGILTGESGCYGGTLDYVKRKKDGRYEVSTNNK